MPGRLWHWSRRRRRPSLELVSGLQLLLLPMIILDFAFTSPTLHRGRHHADSLVQSQRMEDSDLTNFSSKLVKVASENVNLKLESEIRRPSSTDSLQLLEQPKRLITPEESPTNNYPKFEKFRSSGNGNDEYYNDDPLIIKTKKGFVRGSTLTAKTGKQVDAWYGIPYAQKPLGKASDERFGICF